MNHLASTIAVAESQGSHRLIYSHLVGAQHYLQHGDWDQTLLHVDQVIDVPTIPRDSLRSPRSIDSLGH